jgi:hypothetical protein
MQTRLLLIFVFAVVLLAASDSFAAFYKYTDNNGIMCFADNLQSVPEQYRAKAEIVRSEQEQENKPELQKQPQERADAMPGKATIEGRMKSLFSGSALMSVVVVVSALFAFVILGILNADHKKSIKIIRVIILWGMSVYLIVAHGGDVINLFRTVKGEVDTVQRESEEKGKKAARAMKELNAVIQHVDDAASPGSGGVVPEKKD